MRLRRWPAVVLAALVLPVVTPTGAGGAPLPCERRDPFPPGVADDLARRYPGRRFSAQVYDSATGCTYALHPGQAMTTASVVKLSFLAGVVLRAQREGRDVSPWERDRLWPMITESADPPASALWSSLGGTAGMAGVDAAFGLGSTSPAPPTWGLTTTTAADQVTLLRQVVTGEAGPLGAAARSTARFYLSHVVPSQRWGASANVPGEPGWTVFQKNGFAPSGCCSWRLNTAGWVERPDGTGWAIVVLSDGWPSEASGIDAVHALSATINRSMLALPFGVVDAVRPLTPAGRYRMAGWAADPSDGAPAVPVHVVVDGAVVVGTTTASLDRPDVAAALGPGYGAARGFSVDVSLPVPDGVHTVCAVGLNIGPPGPPSLLGCAWLDVRASPVGFVDSLTRTDDGSVRVAGWAWDPTEPGPIRVHVYVDGIGAASVAADRSRPDVAAAVPGAGAARGFEATFAAPAGPGPHLVCAYGINTGPGADRLLGCR